MKTSHLVSSLVALGAAAAVPLSGGCVDVCADTAVCDPAETSSSNTMATTTSSTSGGPGGGGDGGGPSSSSSSSSSDGGGGSGEGGAGGGPGCSPSEGATLAADCGIYVDASAAPGGDGTQGSPASTIDEAVALADAAGESRIYLCAGSYLGGQAVAGGTSILGGYACDWTRAEATRPSIAAEVGGAGGPVATLVVTGAGTTRIADVDVTATLAAATPGASAIGLMAVDADLDVTRVAIDVANGAEGSSGGTPSGGELDGASPEENGAAGCVSLSSVVGGAGGIKTCGGQNSFGGDGGSGTVNGGGSSDGADGSSSPDAVPVASNGGAGEPIGSNCANGNDGTAGQAGAPAPVSPTSLGTLGASGFFGTAGSVGMMAGTPGQGGGGGGGARGQDHCAPNAGPSGGGGGSGGCGGAPGGGGQAGGASIGIALVRSTLTITSSSLTVGDGGAGGAGSPGQPGGAGAGGANGGGSGACNGGQGGRGGWGGAGGGGSGGHAIAIAHVESPSTPALGEDVTFEIGAEGAAGAGGDGPDDAFNGNSPTNVGPEGNPGVRCALLEFGVDPGEACQVAAP